MYLPGFKAASTAGGLVSTNPECPDNVGRCPNNGLSAPELGRHNDSVDLTEHTADRPRRRIAFDGRRAERRLVAPVDHSIRTDEGVGPRPEHNHSMREHFLTPASSAATVIRIVGSGAAPNRDAERFSLSVSLTGFDEKLVDVEFTAPALTDKEFQQVKGLPFDDEARAVVAILTVLTEIDQNPDFGTEAGKKQAVEMDAQHVLELIDRPRLTDRELRRYIARRVFEEYSRSTLKINVWFDKLDLLITGATATDFERCCGVLVEEGYLGFGAMGAPPSVEPTAKLVRDVERYGAPKADAVSESDFSADVNAYPPLVNYRESIVEERSRYATALSETELVSVFRAISPTVEAVLRDLLVASGASRTFDNLGQMIAELRRRSIGGPDLWARLNNVHRFGRDLLLHGYGLSDTLVRFACENAFTLLPELASLFPR